MEIIKDLQFQNRSKYSSLPFAVIRLQRFEQSEPSQQQRTSQQLSPMSKKKWELLGSSKKVDELFQASRKNGGVRKVGIPGVDVWVDPHPQKQAENHVLKIMRDGKCKWPRQKLIKVSESYPSMTKTYIPSCTILYRCGDDTGCCSLPTQKCTAKNSTTVELYFTTTRVEVRDGNRTVRQDVEKLTFTNDTECDCVEMMPRDMELERMIDHKKTGCTCPTEFSPRYMSNGLCTCDCFDKQNDCLRYKRGLKYFEHSDRLCIAEGRCEKPLCRFGVYEHKYGRCPKRHEKFQKFSKYIS
ncbi:unnamed protein product [Bemisia tabaci]|uniref:Platelet-derived growth factor (PDGF) family profile domain-containing protein n=2 Tax=Bemisia tabaci TaxID=7038 RepID=A0A9P0ADH6_BEMTA|nr:unnamed protein product [Bemisia tabaci]